MISLSNKKPSERSLDILQVIAHLLLHFFIASSDKLNMTLPDDVDPRKHFFHSNSVKTDSKARFDKIQADFRAAWDRIPLDKRRQVYEIYEPDLKLYNYEWNIETNEISFNL